MACAVGTVRVRRMMNLNFTLDERFCDGLYFARSIKLLNKYLKDPTLLDTPLDHIEQDMP